MVTTQYRGYDIHSIAAPAGGGLVIKALNLLAPFELSLMNPAEWALIINQALALAANSRYEDYYELDLLSVQDKEWAEKASEDFIVPKWAAAEATLYHQEIQNLRVTNVDWSGDTWGEDSHHTTHFTTADCQGMVVSITQTVGPLFGSKVITPGLGFVYASTMGAYLTGTDQAPGSRPRTTIAPTIVTKDGKTVMVLGAAGGLRILSGIVQTISRFIDQGMSLQAAVLAPRVHPMSAFDSLSGNYVGRGLQINAEFTPNNGWTAADSLLWLNAGFEVTPLERYGAFARVHALCYDEMTQLWTGIADADWEGTAKGPVESICTTQ
jgi:gamma-glutamyltranspeptidase/glutathione hydrolase